MTDPRRTATATDPAHLDASSAISPEDIERAKLAAQRDGTPLLNAMLNAREEGQP